jgi:nondiscriminating glutamyl-tRNA synthetase
MIRVRFAPSPTGNLHVGNARTAVLNHLFARHNNGEFILRVEDTDVERSEAVYEDSIKEDLNWLGVTWDEGPYRQTDRINTYRSHADALLEKGLAYKCFCSKEDLEKARDDAQKRGLPPRYSGKCRKLSDDAAREMEKAGTPYVIRFKSLGKGISFRDQVHGEIYFPADHVDDFILVRSDGIPSYNFAAAVDDLLMNITHVIRGSDHLSNTPKQIMLFEVLGHRPPAYAHHSLLTGTDRKPLSKRHGATRVTEFRNMGVLPMTLINYLGIIGRKTSKELMDRQELIDSFSLDSLSASDSLFDIEKLLWLNKEYIRCMDIDELLTALGEPAERREQIALLRENARTLEEIKSLFAIFDSDNVDREAVNYLLSLEQRENILDLLDVAGREEYDSFEAVFKNVERKSLLSRKNQFMFLRIVVTGKQFGPPLKEVFQLVPKRIILKRIKCLQTSISNPSEL